MPSSNNLKHTSTTAFSTQFFHDHDTSPTIDSSSYEYLQAMKIRDPTTNLDWLNSTFYADPIYDPDPREGLTICGPIVVTQVQDLAHINLPGTVMVKEPTHYGLLCLLNQVVSIKQRFGLLEEASVLVIGDNGELMMCSYISPQEKTTENCAGTTPAATSIVESETFQP